MRFSKFIVVSALLTGTGLAVYMRADVDRVPSSDRLSDLPERIGTLSSTEIPIDDGTLRLLGDGRFLNRVYQPINPSERNGATDIGLFIGYFPTQRSGQAIHSPQNCLPGAGWSFLSSKDITIPNMSGTVGEYVITNGTAKQMVLYWYRSHGRSIANDYAAKAYMMMDSIRYGRTDGALIRVITPISTHESYESAHDRAVGFAEKISPILPRFIPD